MTPIEIDDSADFYDRLLVTVLKKLFGDRYGANEADAVMSAFDVVGLPKLLEAGSAMADESVHNDSQAVRRWRSLLASLAGEET